MDTNDRNEAFRAAWAEMEASGYQYGTDALEQVRLGWDMAMRRLSALESERDRGYMFLGRWQDFAKRLARRYGWVPDDVLPDDTKTREQVEQTIESLRAAAREALEALSSGTGFNAATASLRRALAGTRP
jgi:hypothetical protein